MLTKPNGMRRLTRKVADAPLGHNVERRYAPALRWLMLFILITVPASWAYHLGVVRTPFRHDVAVDVIADVVVWTAAALSLWLIQKGLVRRATTLFVGAMLIALTTMYVSIGLSRQLLDQTYPVLTIVLGGLVLGRRALWSIYGLLILMFCAGGMVDVMNLTQAAYARPWIGAANLPSLMMSYFAITFVVDRCVSALRDEMHAREQAQEGLLHAQKMETVGRLASGVAHDFNNVLAVISGYAEQMRAAPAPGHMNDAVQGIALAARRGAAVSRKLLTFSRREGIRPEVVDIVAAWEEAAPMLRQLFVDTHVVSFDQRLPRPAHVLIDRAQFELSLLNIAANARDAMAGGGRFEATLRPWQDGGIDGVAVELRDTGSGMSEAVRQRIFEPYFTTKPIGAGTGLGLAVVRDAFMASGGWVQVESAPGEGSCFRLWLPFVDRGKDASSIRAPAAQPERAPRVLLVEDDEELRVLLMDAFDDAGCVAIGKATGEEATALLENPGYTFDVVVSDCHAPGNPGGQLAWLETTRLPVVLISAHGAAEADRLQSFGVDIHCLPKPFVPTVLVDTVRRVVRRPQVIMT